VENSNTQHTPSNGVGTSSIAVAVPPIKDAPDKIHPVQRAQQQRSLKRTLRKRWPLLLAALLILTISACAIETIPTIVSLSSSATAMSQIQSFHVEANLDTSIHLSQPILALTDMKGSLTANGNLAPSQKLTQLDVTLKPTLANITIPIGTITLIVNNQQLYMRPAADTTTQWFTLVLPASSITLGTPDIGSILSILSHVQFHDHGTETLPGTNKQLHHLTVDGDQGILGPLLSNSSVAQQIGSDAFNKAIESISSLQIAADFWIDTATNLINEVDLNATTDINLSALLEALTQAKQPTVSIATTLVNILPKPLTATITTKGSIKFSKFNEPIHITVPANASPLFPGTTPSSPSSQSTSTAPALPTAQDTPSSQPPSPTPPVVPLPTLPPLPPLPTVPPLPPLPTVPPLPPLPTVPSLPPLPTVPPLPPLPPPP
jgi:hypothetical protein